MFVMNVDRMAAGLSSAVEWRSSIDALCTMLRYVTVLHGNRNNLFVSVLFRTVVDEFRVSDVEYNVYSRVQWYR